MNRKGNFGLLLAMMILMAILIVGGFAIAIFIGVIDTATEVIIPEIEGIGVVGSSNISQYAEYTTVPITTLITSFTWIGGIMYMAAILGLIGISIAFRVTMSKVFIVMFFAFSILLIFLSIFMSNIYQDFYEDTGDFGDKLKEQVMLSWLILHSPLIFSVVIFISGIILFSGIMEENTIV